MQVCGENVRRNTPKHVSAYLITIYECFCLDTEIIWVERAGSRQDMIRYGPYFGETSDQRINLGFRIQFDLLPSVTLSYVVPLILGLLLSDELTYSQKWRNPISLEPDRTSSSHEETI